VGKVSYREAFALRWAEVLADATLRDLPYKIELNRFGNIEMSPASTRHARLQGIIAAQLGRQLGEMGVLTECAILTDFGVRVPDVAWASAEFFAENGGASPLARAPDLCIEIRSASNSDEEMALKTAAYLGAGALEVWVVDGDGGVWVTDQAGPQARSRWAVTFDLPPKVGADER
jgi:Uma2 family endonuclease